MVAGLRGLWCLRVLGFGISRFQGFKRLVGVRGSGLEGFRS